MSSVSGGSFPPKTLAAMELNGEAIPPEPEDVTVCFKCGELLTFDEKLLVRKLTEAELKEIESIELETYIELMKAQQQVRQQWK